MAEPYLTHLQQIVSHLGPLSVDNVTLETKHFFSGAALYANGKICASISPAGIALKLPENTRLKLLAEGKGTEFRFFPNGPIKKEYVALSDSTLKDERLLQELVMQSINYVTGKIE
jgi:TfoX/Sxy family transcriptional regulator of competence genes